MVDTVKVHDVIIADVRGGSSGCPPGDAGDSGDRVLIYLVQIGRASCRERV